VSENFKMNNSLYKNVDKQIQTEKDICSSPSTLEQQYVPQSSLLSALIYTVSEKTWCRIYFCNNFIKC